MGPLLPESFLGGRATPSSVGAERKPAGNPVAGTPTCQKPGAEYECYGPVQVRTAYAFASLINHGEDGRGRTIAIIDAYQDPTINHDLAEFDSTFKLPAPPSFEVVAPFGITPFEPSNEEQVGWSGEIALDVEWAHAIAPGAKIKLVLSATAEEREIVATERYVVERHLGDVVSMSYVETEECDAGSLAREEHAVFKKGVREGMTFVAGSGDEGAANLNCEFTAKLPYPEVNLPASDPNVTGVGGTMLKANSNSGKYESESVWNESPEEGAGGGGFSALYAPPRYQKGVRGITTKRGVPDVAYSAAAHGGMAVVWGSSGQHKEFWDFAGTSEGAPQWAALTAIADQVANRRLGNINPALYAIAQAKGPRSFHDITKGNNSYPPVTGYSATPGWDAASGWGSPIAEFLVPALASSHAEHGDQSAASADSLARPTAPVQGGQHKVRALATR